MLYLKNCGKDRGHHSILHSEKADDYPEIKQKEENHRQRR